MLRLIPLLLMLATAGCTGDAPTVKVTREPAAGATLDGAWLDALTARTLDGAAARLDETYARNGVPPEERTARPYVDGRFISLGGTRLAQVELAYSGSPLRVVRISGVRGGELITVSCTAPDGRPPELTDPQDVCGRKVAELLLP